MVGFTAEDDTEETKFPSSSSPSSMSGTSEAVLETASDDDDMEAKQQRKRDEEKGDLIVKVVHNLLIIKFVSILFMLRVPCQIPKQWERMVNQYRLSLFFTSVILLIR